MHAQMSSEATHKQMDVSTGWTHYKAESFLCNNMVLPPDPGTISVSVACRISPPEHIRPRGSPGAQTLNMLCSFILCKDFGRDERVCFIQ